MRWTVRLLLAVIAGVWAVLAFSTPASAHAALIKTDPAADAILDSAPEEVRLTFNEPVNPAASGVRVVAPDGEQVQRGKAVRQDGGRILVTKLADELPVGTFLVSYRVVSADGHPIAGGYMFSIGQPSTPAAEPEIAKTPPVDGLVKAALSTGRYATYLGAALLGGAVAMLLALWPQRLTTAVPRRLGWTGWWLLLAGTVLWLWAQVPYAYGGTLIDLDSDGLTETLDSTLGMAAVARIVLLFVGLPLLHTVFQGRVLRLPWRITLAGLGALALLTWPFTGHSANSPGKLLSIPADALHVGAMALWLGGLIVLAAVTLQRANDLEIAAILPVWSRWALYAIAVITFTGSVQALLEIGPLRAFTNTTYGALVLAKIAGLGLILLLASFARRWINQRVTTFRRTSLRRLVAGEIAVALIMLGIATALTQTPPGYTATENQVSQDLPFNLTIDAKTLDLQINVDPARRGNNSIQLTVFGKDDKPVIVQQWKATAELPSKQIAPITIPLLALTDDHAAGEIFLPQQGDWEFHFTVRTSDIDQVTVDRVIRIE